MFEVVGLQGSRNDKILFSKITFKLNRGQWLWVKGKNGQGKTTLLKMLAGLLMQDSGCIYWNAQKLSRFDPLFLQDMIYLGHVPALNPMLSFIENLRWAKLLRNNSNVNSTELDTELSALSLVDLQDTPCEQLSFGQKQRAALLTLKLFEQTPLWILDEPATGLDTSAKNWLHDKLNKHLMAGGLAIIASHEDLNLTQSPFILNLSVEAS